MGKMTPFVILSLVASAFAAPQLPAGLTAAACPNYPYCDATGGFLPVPDVPGAGEVIAAQEAIIRSHQGVGVPALPGLEVEIIIIIIIVVIIHRVISLMVDIIIPIISLMIDIII